MVLEKYTFDFMILPPVNFRYILLFISE